MLHLRSDHVTAVIPVFSNASETVFSFRFVGDDFSPSDFSEAFYLGIAYCISWNEILYFYSELKSFVIKHLM